jgi:hypothetical protein
LAAISSPYKACHAAAGNFAKSPPGLLRADHGSPFQIQLAAKHNTQTATIAANQTLFEYITRVRRSDIPQETTLGVRPSPYVLHTDFVSIAEIADDNGTRNNNFTYQSLTVDRLASQLGIWTTSR